ncbi:MAG TPA: DUF1573 domain-containing protein [Bacteroidales bacterium]|jgi:hypothetical protein|nr:DUF1573 domain-containing protein [Bacteroidales bacterium]HXK90847.1 DUF1573 domain-containing protein [Bacteroidales bacterium]
MKYNFLILFILTISFIGCKKNNNISSDIVNNPASLENNKVSASNAIIKFETTEHDFGDIMEGEKVSYSFKFNNVGKNDLVITSVSTTCGCTVTDFPKDPLKPGESGTIEVTFNSSGRSGKQVKVITVATNANPSMSQLTIKANVRKP